MQHASSSPPFIGFDRFVSLSWMDKALDTAILGGEPADIHRWLADRIQGASARKKTGSVLSTLWLRSAPETESLRREALALAQMLSLEERFVLHWGMALVTYPLFRTTVSIIGRLSRLQGEFQSQEVRSRVLESYGSIGTVPRAVNRIIQSVKEWGVVEHNNERYVAGNSYTLTDSRASVWLLEACMRASGRDHWELNDLLCATELFPFQFGKTGHLLPHQSTRFTVTREGLDREIVLLNPPSTQRTA